MRAYSRRGASKGAAMRTHGNLFLRALTADGYRTYAVTYGRVIIAGERRMTRVTRTYDSYDHCSIVRRNAGGLGVHYGDLELWKCDLGCSEWALENGDLALESVKLGDWGRPVTTARNHIRGRYNGWLLL